MVDSRDITREDISMWSDFISFQFINEYFLVQITFATQFYFITTRNQIVAP